MVCFTRSELYSVPLLCIVLNGYCRNRNAEKADQLLQELHKSFGSDVISMGACISAWSQCTKYSDRALERSEEILSDIVERYRTGLVGPRERHVDAWVFEGVARLWLKSRKPDSAERIINLIKDMESLSEDAPGRFLPSPTLYLLGFDALAAAGDVSGRRTLELFDAYERLSRENRLPPPSVRLLSTVLASLTKSTRQQDAVTIYHEILRHLGDGTSSESLHPRTITTLMRSILGSDSEDAGDLCMQLLNKTIAVARRCPDHVKLNTLTMNTIILGLASKGLPDEAWLTFDLMTHLASEGFETFPDAATYSFLAKALAAARTPLTVERLDALVHQVTLMQEHGSLSPDKQVYDTIFVAYRNVWSLHIEAGERAYDLLIRLENFRGIDDRFAPGLGSYRAVCEALAKSKLPNSIEMLEDAYQRARYLSQAGVIEELDRDICYAAITGYARQHDARSIEKAEEIIADMEYFREHDKHSAGAPDVRVYNRVLFAYSSAATVDKAERAFAMFSRMKKAYDQGHRNCKPNIHSYNAVSYVVFLFMSVRSPLLHLGSFYVCFLSLCARWFLRPLNPTLPPA